jgi:hypothetical protein
MRVGDESIRFDSWRRLIRETTVWGANPKAQKKSLSKRLLSSRKNLLPSTGNEGWYANEMVVHGRQLPPKEKSHSAQQRRRQ